MTVIAVCPPVDARPIGLVVDDLRCDVVRGAAECLRRVAVPHSLLAHTKVGNLDVTLLYEGGR